MKISVISAQELDASLTAKWVTLQQADDTLRSPYYRPEFTQLIAGYGNDVRVAVIESDGAVQGFFPHQLDTWRRLIPVAGKLNDYHGMVAARDFDMDGSELLKACGANYFRFNHMPVTQRVFAPYVRFDHVSPVLDLQGGWAAYVQRLAEVQNKSTPGIITSVKKSSNRIERDLGPLRFEMHASDTRIIDTLMQLKTEQRARTVGLAGDPFAVPWVRQMMFDLVERRQTDFRGDLCALYAGDTMVACHLGLRSHTTLHGWFSIYRPEHAYYQPALIMYLKLAQASADDGLALFDMGRGTQDYKLRLCTRMIPMGEGALSRPQLLGDGLMAAKRAKAQLKALLKPVSRSSV